MSIIKNLRNKIVYALTEKPEHYVHVDKPKTLQDRRQVQYNNWCKRKGVYNGSYLPEDPNTLTKKGKGWVETTSEKERALKQKSFQRKSSGQMVQYHPQKNNRRQGIDDEHYHWLNGKNMGEHEHLKKNKRYYDRYGNTHKPHTPPTHLAPLDRDYNYRRDK